MNEYIKKEDLMRALQDIQFEAYIDFSRISTKVAKLPTYEFSENKCGTCAHFERYSAVRGYCREHARYYDAGDSCSDWKDGGDIGD